MQLVYYRQCHVALTSHTKWNISLLLVIWCQDQALVLCRFAVYLLFFQYTLLYLVFTLFLFLCQSSNPRLQHLSLISFSMVFFQVFLGQPLFGREFIIEYFCTGLMVFFWSTWLFLKQRLPYSVFTLSLQDLLLLFLVPYEHPGKLKFGLFNPATAYNSHFHMIDSLKDSCVETSSSCLTVIKERIVFKFFKDSQKTKDHHKTFQS